MTSTFPREDKGKEIQENAGLTGTKQRGEYPSSERKSSE